MHAVDRDEPVRPLDADDAAVRGGAQHRADRLRAERQRHHAGGDRRGGAGGGASGRVLRVPGISRRRRIAIGKLRRVRLPDDDRAGRPQPRDDDGVSGWRGVRPRFRAGPCRHAGHVDDVLDTDGDAVQWAAQRAALRFGFALTRGRQRARLVEMHPREDRGLDGLDPGEQRFRQRDGRKRPLTDACRRLRCAELDQLVIGHRSLRSHSSLVV